MSNYDVLVDRCVEEFDRFHRCVRETNRRLEKVTAAEVDFLNAVDEQAAAYDRAMEALALMQKNAPEAEVAS